jgi:septal ring factor EnvC (AmiA/AmiB activator)
MIVCCGKITLASRCPTCGGHERADAQPDVKTARNAVTAAERELDKWEDRLDKAKAELKKLKAEQQKTLTAHIKTTKAVDAKVQDIKDLDERAEDAAKAMEIAVKNLRKFA